VCGKADQPLNVQKSLQIYRSKAKQWKQSNAKKS
jgi:hypothetical protein